MAAEHLHRCVDAEVTEPARVGAVQVELGEWIGLVLAEHWYGVAVGAVAQGQEQARAGTAIAGEDHHVTGGVDRRLGAEVSPRPRVLAGQVLARAEDGGAGEDGVVDDGETPVVVARHHLAAGHGGAVVGQVGMRSDGEAGGAGA